MIFTDCSSNSCVIIQRIPRFHVPGLLHKFCHELVKDGALDEHPGPVGADLALGQEVGHQGPLHCVLHVSILEDDERRLASELKCHVLNPLGPSLHDPGPGGYAASEGELVQALVTGQQRPSLPLALDHVVHAVRDPGLLEDLAQDNGLQGGQGAGLVDEGVTAGKGGRHLPGAGLQGIVPCPDSAHHAQRLTGGVTPGASRQPRLVTNDCGGEAAVILEAGNHSLEVCPRLPDGLSIVLDVQPRDVLEVVPDDGGRPGQQSPPLHPRQPGPGGESRPGRGHGSVHISLAGAGDLAQEAASPRTQVGEAAQARVTWPHSPPVQPVVRPGDPGLGVNHSQA